MAEKQIKEQKLLNEELQTEFEKRESILKGLREQFNLEKELANLIRGKNDLNRKQLDIIDDVLDHSKSILDNQKTLTEETFTQVDLEKLERELIREGLQDRTQIIAKLKEKQNIQKETNRIVNLQANTYKSIGDSIDGFIQKIPGIGGILSDVLGTNELGKEMSESFRTSIEKVFTGGGFGDNLSQVLIEGATSGAVEAGLFKTFFKGSKFGIIASLAGLGGLLSISFQQGLESLGFINTFKRTISGGAFDALNEAFGNINKATFRNLASLRLQSFLFGTSADESAKILQAQTEIAGLTDKQAFAIQTQISRFAALRGVLPKDVLSDLANNTELFAKFAQDGGRNLGLAAVQAKQLGLGLSTVGTIAESVLDFQTSIESELQASLLIGRQLNLNRARELALAGDLAGLQQEVVRLVGSEQELNKLNVIQRKSLASALGITVAELGRLAGGEVELQSTEVQQNTQAIKILTQALALRTAAAAAPVAGRLISNVAGTATAGAALRAGGAGLLRLVPQVAGIAIALQGLNMLMNRIAGSNDQIAGNTKTTDNFTPFTSTEALAN